MTKSLLRCHGGEVRWLGMKGRVKQSTHEGRGVHDYHSMAPELERY